MCATSRSSGRAQRPARLPGRRRRRAPNERSCVASPPCLRIYDVRKADKSSAGSGGAPMDYEMISVDDHIDLQYVPRDVWTTRLPEGLRDRGPQVVELNDGTSAWVCDGDNWGRWAGGRRSSEKRSYQTALERAGLDEEGVLRPTEPELRL